MAEYSSGAILKSAVKKIYKKLIKAVQREGQAGVQELRNAELLVLRGQRGGKTYHVPGTGRVKYNKKNHKATITYRNYRASAPGEAPAVRTGVFRTSWQPYVKERGDGVMLRLNTSQNGRRYPGYLEHGTSKMQPRPYVKAIQNKAEPQIRRIYNNIHL